MKYAKLILFLSIIFSAGLLSNCANVGAPMGGPKDTLAPNLVRTLPTNKSLNYQGLTVELVFDEFIKIENLKKQLIITPRVEAEYEYKVIKNRVEIEFAEKLEENTTYTLNFRDAVKDITEGNQASNLVLVFSTGSYLDSMEVKGKVTALMDGSKQKNVVVALYQKDDTVDIFKAAPKYFTKTDTAGTYHLQNIKNGNYKIYAFEDVNDNAMCESQYEAYGFKSDPFKLDSIVYRDLVLYNADIRELKLNNTSNYGPYFEAKYNKYITSYNIESNTLIYNNLYDKNSVIRFYNTQQNFTDSTLTYLYVTDSIGQTRIDTTYVKFKESKMTADEFKINTTLPERSEVDEKFSAEIRLNKPMTSYNADSIFIRYDSLVQDYFFNQDKITINDNKTIIQFEISIDKAKLKIDTTSVKDRMGNIIKREPNEQIYMSTFDIYFGKGAFISIEGDSAKPIKKSYKLKNPANTGSIKGKVLIPYSSYTVQLLDKNQKILQEVKDIKEYNFTNLTGGLDYYLRILIDVNENGTWELGNILENRESEPVLVYPNKIPLRAGWEVINNDITM
ncbi:Ig-like domain-containing domain [Cytophagales bacterium LB-30]|uniref:Ig-like domain-containing domain n=1 Tax=Shiella aurantiaca TaxID=3058365 RepID=A0ABT8F553_9BACT|nr:Ig-like domain-containing domain [Shiella aurantiaca]MDN4165592.1 Ig-like domain-containing domain [Shiella aurantiaca]